MNTEKLEFNKIEFSKDEIYRNGTDDERRLVFRMCQALSHAWRSAPASGSRELVFENHSGCVQVFEQMNRMGQNGLLLGALCLSRYLRGLERQVRSRFLTGLLLAQHEMMSHGQPVRECETSLFGIFIGALVADFPDVILEWTEDMNTGIGEAGLPPQPTAAIRGLLLSYSFDHRRAARFWEMAARSERFPERVFSDPCPPHEGKIFCSSQLRAFGLFLSLAPEAAVRRFLPVIRDRAVDKTTIVCEDDNRKVEIIVEKATEQERRGMLAVLVGHIEPAGRCELVQAILDGKE